MKLADITGVKQSFVPNLVTNRSEHNRYIIMFTPYGATAPIVIYNKQFARHLINAVNDFQYSLQHGIIVATARPRMPNEWVNSDTIQRSPTDINSIHRGIVRAVNEERIPVFEPNTGAIIDLVAAARQLTANQQRAIETLKKYYPLQPLIISSVTSEEAYRIVPPEPEKRNYQELTETLVEKSVAGMVKAKGGVDVALKGVEKVRKLTEIAKELYRVGRKKYKE